MGERFKFTKMHGAGNDFILFHRREVDFPLQDHSLIQRLCDRHFGIGADGLMVVEPRTADSFRLFYFNSDGRPAAMCGNGARCAVYFAHLYEPGTTKFRLEIGGATYWGEVTGWEQVRVQWEKFPRKLPDPGIARLLPEQFPRFAFIDSGVPHLVLETTEELPALDVMHWGSYFRNHPAFAPAGTNVNFVQKKGEVLHIRTYERGVEGETLACGTGSLAAALAALEWYGIRSPVRLKAPGGELQVSLAPESRKVWLEGPAKVVFRGEFDPQEIGK